MFVQQEQLACGKRDFPGHALGKGDWVRLTHHNRLLRYQSGDRGQIIDGPHSLGGRDGYYLVVMDRDDPPRLLIFMADEIERDGA
jgi:hypothetical protein